jgi:RNA polymerase sigma factor (TIGR02999 family)
MLNPAVPPPPTVSQILRAAACGDAAALEELFPLVHEELRGVARRQLRQAGERHTLCTDELVNEAYLKLTAAAPVDWEGKAHFFGVAARAMRQILVDYARHRNAQKRSGGWQRLTLSARDLAYEARFDELLTLNEALERLDRLNPRLRKVVECRFFGGMSEEQIAHVLGVSPRTVERDWQKARLFLYQALHPEGGGDEA